MIFHGERTPSDLNEAIVKHSAVVGAASYVSWVTAWSFWLSLFSGVLGPKPHKGVYKESD